MGFCQSEETFPPMRRWRWELRTVTSQCPWHGVIRLLWSEQLILIYRILNLVGDAFMTKRMLSLVCQPTHGGDGGPSRRAGEPLGGHAAVGRFGTYRASPSSTKREKSPGSARDNLGRTRLTGPARTQRKHGKARQGSVPSRTPNQGLKPTARSVRSSVAPASGSGSGLAFGF
jgi:hypothetical protein